MLMVGFIGRHKRDQGEEERDVSHLDRLQDDTESFFISDVQI